MVSHATKAWTQIADLASPAKLVWGLPTAAPNSTTVNILEVGAFVEGIVDNVRAEHASGRVALAPDLLPSELTFRSQLTLGRPTPRFQS